MRCIQSRDANSYEAEQSASSPPTSSLLCLLFLTVLGKPRWRTGYSAQHPTEYVVDATFRQCRGWWWLSSKALEAYFRWACDALDRCHPHWQWPSRCHGLGWCTLRTSPAQWYSCFQTLIWQTFAFLIAVTSIQRPMKVMLLLHGSCKSYKLHVLFPVW